MAGARGKLQGEVFVNGGGALADPHVSGREGILWRTAGRVRHRKAGFCGAPLGECATEMLDSVAHRWGRAPQNVGVQI